MLTRTGEIVTSATFSDDGVYRYELSWVAGAGRLLVVWLLNPSSADERHLDPTLARVHGHAVRNGYAGIRVINLRGLIQKQLHIMRRHPAAEGPDNKMIVRKVLSDAREMGAPVVCG